MSAKFLKALFYSEFLLETNIEGDGILFSFENGLTKKIKIFIGNLETYSLDNFFTFLIETPFYGERQFSSIRFSGVETNTIGYVFPVATLTSGNELPDEQWIRIYASAATEYILSGSANNLVLKKDYSITDCIELMDIFPENMAVVVLGKEQLSLQDVLLEEVQISIQAHGFRLYPSSYAVSIKTENKGNDFDFDDRFKIKKISKDLRGDLFVLRWLISKANNEENLYAKFLTYYQVIEALLVRIFKHAIEAASTYMDKTDPWAFREKLTDIPNEKWRIERLGKDFLNNADTNIFAECKEKCLIFLRALSIDDSKLKEKSWPVVLYEARKIIVHKQTTMISCEQDILINLCGAFEETCYELLANYSEQNGIDALRRAFIPVS